MSDTSANVNAVPDDNGFDEFEMEQQVMQYLRSHPDFFIRFPSMLTEVNIPHSKKGTVSLVEIQSELLRNKVKSLSTKLKQLIEIAHENQEIYEVFAALNLQLLQATSLEEVRSTLASVLKSQLGLSCVKIHLFSGEQAIPEIQQRLFKDKRFKNTDYFFGRLSENEKQLMFADAVAESSALVLLGNQKQFGILAIGSAEPTHFTPEMDTLLLNQLRSFLNTVLPDLLAQK